MPGPHRFHFLPADAPLASPRGPRSARVVAAPAFVALALFAAACNGGGDATSTALDATSDAAEAIAETSASLSTDDAATDLAMTDAPDTDNQSTNDENTASEAPADDDSFANEDPASETPADDDPATDDHATENPATPASIPVAPAELAWLTVDQRECLGDKLGADTTPDTATDETALTALLTSCVSFGEVTRHNALDKGVKLSAVSVDCLNDAVTAAEISMEDLGAVMEGTATSQNRTEITAVLLGCLTQAERSALAGA